MDGLPLAWSGNPRKHRPPTAGRGLFPNGSAFVLMGIFTLFPRSRREFLWGAVHLETRDDSHVAILRDFDGAREIAAENSKLMSPTVRHALRDVIEIRAPLGAHRSHVEKIWGGVGLTCSFGCHMYFGNDPHRDVSKESRPTGTIKNFWLVSERTILLA